MTKKEYCTDRPTVAYYSGFGGLEVKHIEYGTDDYVYLVASAWNGRKSYHRLKIHYGMKIRLHTPVRTALSAFRIYTRLILHCSPLSAASSFYAIFKGDVTWRILFFLTLPTNHRT